MKVLVLGASGFVGRHVVDSLVASGHEVLAGMRSGTHPNADHQQVESVAVDPVAEPKSLQAVLTQGIDGVINAAGQIAGTRTAMVAANVHLVAQLLDELMIVPAGNRPRLVHVGSAAEYDPPVGRTPVGPGHPTNPSGVYGITKLCGTKLVVEALGKGDIAGTVIRLFNPVGPGSPASTLAGSAVQRLRDAIDRGLDEIRFGDLAAARDFIDVRDAADLLVEACVHRGKLPDIMNAGTGIARPAGDLVAALTCGAAWSGSIVTDGAGSPRSRVPWHAADVTATRAALNWRPRRSLEETMRDQWLAGSATVGVSQ